MSLLIYLDSMLFGNAVSNDLPDCMSHIQLCAILEDILNTIRLGCTGILFNQNLGEVSDLHDWNLIYINLRALNSSTGMPFQPKFRGSYACTLSTITLAVCYSTTETTPAKSKSHAVLLLICNIQGWVKLLIVV